MGSLLGHSLVTQEVATTSHVFSSYIPSGVESTSERSATSEELGVARGRRNISQSTVYSLSNCRWSTVRTKGTKKLSQCTVTPSTTHNVCQDVVTSFHHIMHNLSIVPSCKRRCVYIKTNEEIKPLTQVSLQTHWTMTSLIPSSLPELSSQPYWHNNDVC